MLYLKIVGCVIRARKEGKMKIFKAISGYFSKTELILWLSSLFLITLSFILFDRKNYLSFSASMTGATSLILCAKGNYWGHIFGIVFSLLYACISYTFSYFGEVITYMFMTLPMAVAALFSWIRHPSKESKTEVLVNQLPPKEIAVILALAAVVTVVFHFILKKFNTANLFISTLSVTASFTAVALSARRSPYYAVAYMANDIILITLWILATLKDISYLGVVICFFVFLINDIYSFKNWQRLQRKQQQTTAQSPKT